jgi:hypothetical protein
MTNASPQRWCLLMHALPARPLYLRARIRRLLADCGAAPIRKAVYALPAADDTLAALLSIAAEIEAGGGTVYVCEATFPDPAAADAIEREFNAELQSRFAAWTKQARRALARGAAKGASPAAARLRARFERLRGLDHFGAPGAAQAAEWFARLSAGPERRAPAHAFAGLTWVTRRGLHVDRLGCAWLVLRFVDPGATFRFTASPQAPLAPGEIGFDMPDAAIGHEDGGCSFETLVRRAGLRNPGVARIAEIVHDIDIRDGRYSHAETAGFEQMLLGVIASNPRDDDRLERGVELFDTLYAALGSGARLPDGGPGVAPRVKVPPALRRKKPNR